MFKLFITHNSDENRYCSNIFVPQTINNTIFIFIVLLSVICSILYVIISLSYFLLFCLFNLYFLPTYQLIGSTTIARGWDIFPSKSVFLVWDALSRLATLIVFLYPSLVQYKLFPIQSTEMPSTLSSSTTESIPQNCHN